MCFIDNRRDPLETGKIDDPTSSAGLRISNRRRLHDGTKYDVVEIFYEPDELTRLL